MPKYRIAEKATIDGDKKYVPAVDIEATYTHRGFFYNRTEQREPVTGYFAKDENGFAVLTYGNPQWVDTQDEAQRLLDFGRQTIRVEEPFQFSSPTW